MKTIINRFVEKCIYWASEDGSCVWINIFLVSVFWNSRDLIVISFINPIRHYCLLEIRFSPNIRVKDRDGKLIYHSFFWLSIAVMLWMPVKYRTDVTIRLVKRMKSPVLPFSLRHLKLRIEFYTWPLHRLKTNKWLYYRLFDLYMWLSRFNGKEEHCDHNDNVGGSGDYGKYTSSYGNEFMDTFMIHLPFRNRIFLTTEGSYKYIKIGRKW